jgi:hypothetical protein
VARHDGEGALHNSAVEADVALATLWTTQLNASRWADRMPKATRASDGHGAPIQEVRLPVDISALLARTNQWKLGGRGD